MASRLRQALGQGDDDLQLIHRVAQGERQAFDQLMLKHVDQAYSVAYRMTQHAELAEDIVQDVFIKVWQHATTWDEQKAKFSTWLHRMVVNRCIDESRAAVHRYMEACEDIQAFSSSEQADRLVIDSEKQHYFEQALQQLTEQQQAALTLTYSAGLSNKEAALVMELKVKAFESLLGRARQQLKTYLATFYTEEGE